MNNPLLQFNYFLDADERSSSESEVESTSTWDSEASNEDSNDAGEVDLLADEGCADETYWEDDIAADAWIARFPGGTSNLYPQLFVVKPRRGKVLTPPRYPNINSLLHLPPEIRNRIYKHYFDRDEEVKRPKENYAPFRDGNGIEMQRIRLGSENVELKFWLSTALLQTSRQVRFEAIVILFNNRVITVEWLPVLPRFVEFLGKEGCAMVRYLDIWDTLNLQGDNNAIYRDIITSITHFSNLQHLRIVLCWDIGRSGLWSDRTHSWFDQNDWEHNGVLKKQAVPKLRSEDIEMHCPEYEVLKNVRAQKLTFAVETPWADRYLEFDRSYGAYPEISSHAARMQSAPSSTNLVTSSISPQGPEAFETIEIQPFSSALTSNTEFDHKDLDNPTWQETDTLANKTIPLYNFLREFFYKNPPEAVRGEKSFDGFVSFPTARKSTGSIMQDCAFCYLSERHCGHHAVPDQPPFELTRLEGEDEEEDVKILQTRFENLSYADMQYVCQQVAQWMEHFNMTELLNFVPIFDYQGWPEMPNSKRLDRLDAAVEAGWTGKRVDKDEVPPWDVLYREVRLRHSYRCRFCEARSS